MPRGNRVPRDQAAGLRRRATARPNCIHCVSASSATAVRLGSALHQLGWRVLRVDAARLRDSQLPVRSLFDWPRQLARGRPDVLPAAHGDVWRAPGLAADAAGFDALAARYEAVLLDVDLACDAWVPLPAADNHLILDVSGETLAVLQAFRLLKTAAVCQPACTVNLIGDALACVRLREACARFLDGSFTSVLACFCGEIEPFAALAARMAGEEKGRSARR